MHLYLLATSPPPLTHEQIAWGVAAIVSFFAAHAGSLLTKLHASQAVKGAVTFVLGIAAGVIPTVVWAPHAPWSTYALACLFAIAGQAAFHYIGMTNPTAQATAKFGLSDKKRHRRKSAS